jgi:hypothetical protein
MTRPPPFSVRSRRALMVMRDEREISIVRRQLSRLGMTISEHDPAEPPPRNEEFTKPHTSKNWMTAFDPDALCSPPFCISCAVTACRRRTRFRLFDRPRCGIARRSKS